MKPAERLAALDDAAALIASVWAGDPEVSAALELHRAAWATATDEAVATELRRWGNLVTAAEHLDAAGEPVLARALRDGVRRKLLRGVLSSACDDAEAPDDLGAGEPWRA